MNARERFLAAVLSMLFCLGLGAAFTWTAQADDPALRASPSAFSFGDIVAGEVYPTDSDLITLRATSEAEVVITSIEVAGTDSALFEVSDSGCSGSALFECYVYPTFTPDGTLGQKLASIEVESNAGSFSIPLSANEVELAGNAPALKDGIESDALPSADGSPTSGLAATDFNGDGLADVATKNSVVQEDFTNLVEVGVAFGQSDGTLGPPVSYPAGEFLGGNLITGNFDNTNGPDIVSMAGGVAFIFLNDGDGVFTAGGQITSGGSVGFLSPGDFDEDGDLDFTVTDAGLIEVFLGDGEGGFTKAGEQSTGSDDDFTMGVTTAVADFRGDGSNDIAVTDYNGRAKVFLSDGDGTFTPGSSVRLAGSCGCKDPWGIEPTDVNGDGRDDLTVALFAESQTATLIAQPGGSMLLSQVNTAPMSPDGYATTPKMVGNGDLNGDGIPEMVSVGYNGDSLTINSGLPSGVGFRYAEGISMPGVAGNNYISPNQVKVADFNGDGRNDVIVGSDYGKNVLFINDGQPGPVPSPQSFDFGEVYETTSSDPERVLLSNDGGLAPLRVTGVELMNDDAADFIVADTDCDTAPILVGESCFVDVVFSPTGTPGPRITDLVFATNSETDPEVFVPLTGTSVALPPPVAPSVDPVSIDFGGVVTGTTSEVATVTVTNEDEIVPLVVESVGPGGFSSADFKVVDETCTAAPVPVGGACAADVTFDPVGPAGKRDTTLTFITNSEEDELVDVPLSGLALSNVPTGSAAPTRVDFGNATVGTTASSPGVVLTNSGFVPLETDTVTLSGTGVADFSIGKGCTGKTLAPEASCTIAAVFAPTSPGARSASITIETNARPDGQIKVTLSGTGTAGPAPKPAPRVIIGKRPRKKYLIRTKTLKLVKVAFRSNQAGSRFQCRIDRRKFRGCKSPKVFRKVRPGVHAIRVRAIKTGKTGPAKVLRFKVVRKRR